MKRNLRYACAGASVSIWGDAPGHGGVESAQVLTAEESPSGGALVLLGTDRPVANWLAAGRVEQVLLIATREAPCTTLASFAVEDGRAGAQRA